MFRFPIILCFIQVVTLVASKTVTYDWTLSWVTANPDGELARPVIAINGEWPCPAINVTVGDNVVVNVHNKLGNETTSIHYHGLYQKGSNSMDGPPGVNQCDIPPGSSYTYAFKIDQPGSYWYHSHTAGQTADGLRGPIIVQDPNSPYARRYDSELLLRVTDWYHNQAPSLIPKYYSPEENPSGSEPVPYSLLMNEAKTTRLAVETSKTYLVRVINMATFAQTYLHFDQHNMTIIAVDGVYTEAREVSSLYIATAQRYDILLRTQATRTKNFAFVSSFDETAFDRTPAFVHPNTTGHLVYDASKSFPEATNVGEMEVIDDMTLVPYDRKPLLCGTPNKTVTLNISFFEQDNQNRAGFNNITYLRQPVPSLYTAMTSGNAATNESMYGTNSNTQVFEYDSLVEVVVNNFDTGSHPLHLHGHAPQLISRSAGLYSTPKRRKRRGLIPQAIQSSSVHYPETPIRRDTWIVPPRGQTVIRFQVLNPGVWLFHCHMDWHADAGMTATFIAAPLELQNTQKIDPRMIEICRKQGIPVAGNAVGNTKDWSDMKGEVTTCPTNPRGALIAS